MKTFLIAALLASAIAAPVSAAELVTNGGFESLSGLNNGWSYTVSNTLSVGFSPAAHSGDGWLRMAAEDQPSDDFLYQTLTTVVGETYHYSFFLAGATTDQTAPSAFLAEIGGATVGFFFNTGTFDYVETAGDFIATSTSTDIYFEAYNSLGLYLLDDVSVTGPVAGHCTLRVGCGGGVPEPATWALLLAGFGGVGALLRSRRGRSGLAA